MNNSKLYVGHLVQVTPCKGYGFISPKWNDEEDFDKNIYCYYASNREKARRSCYIKMLDKSKTFLREKVKNFKGEILWKATDPQKIFFRVAIQATENGNKLMAYDLFDERHLSEEEKAEAEANSVVKPSFADVFTVAENGEEIDEKTVVKPIEEATPVKETLVEEAKEEASVATVEGESTKEPERKEEDSKEENSSNDGLEKTSNFNSDDEEDSEEDKDYEEDDDSSYYEDLAKQCGYDDEVVDCYKPISTKEYDDEIVKDKKSQKKTSKDKRAQKAFKTKKDED